MSFTSLYPLHLLVLAIIMSFVYNPARSLLHAALKFAKETIRCRFLQLFSSSLLSFASLLSSTWASRTSSQVALQSLAQSGQKCKQNSDLQQKITSKFLSNICEINAPKSAKRQAKQSKWFMCQCKLLVISIYFSFYIISSLKWDF